MRVALIVVTVLATVLLLRACLGDETPQTAIPTVPAPPAGAAPGRTVEPFTDPFAWAPDRAEDLAKRAAEGNAQPLFSFSPGGIVASAARTAKWRKLVEAAAEDAGVDPDRLEGLVLLESAGREDALTAFGLEGAAGLVQIVEETGRNLLGMSIDLARSKRLTRQISRALLRADLLRVEKLRRVRARIDPRFDPRQALAAAARYLTIAKEKFAREDYAFVSYHMGMGNLQGVLDAFGPAEHGWVEVYFGSTPRRHREAYAKLAGFNDDSSNYLWKIEAAMDVMKQFREEPDALRARAALHTAKASAEEVLHPASETERFEDPDDLEAAWDDEEIVAFPDLPGITGLRRDGRMGELARRVGAPAALYRGLRPAALALALYLGAEVRAIAGDTTALRVTSTVRDQAYQAQLVRRNREATRKYSLHTTGWAFDVARRYRNRAHAQAFQYALDRLRSLNLIAYAREPGAIHITVSSDAKALLPLLDRIEPAG
jgi:hypothetical protein